MTYIRAVLLYSIIASTVFFVEKLYAQEHFEGYTSCIPAKLDPSNEATFFECEDFTALSISSDQIEEMVSGLEENLFLQDNDFEKLKNDINLTAQSILSAADFGGGLVIARFTAGLAHNLSPVPQKVVMATPVKRGFFVRTAKGGLKLVGNLLSITGWLRRISKVFVIYSVASPSLRAWKIFKENKDPGIAPVIPLTKEGIDFIKTIPERINLPKLKNSLTPSSTEDQLLIDKIVLIELEDIPYN